MLEKNLHQRSLPGKIRVSTGTAKVLGLIEIKVDAEPTTAYLMTYKTGKCTSNCSFCPQARESESKAELLSRVSWPFFEIEKVISALAEGVTTGKIKRVCIQALTYPDVIADLEAVVKEIRKHVLIPISVSCQPLNFENIKRLAESGVDRIGISLDVATERLFSKIKGKETGGPYCWERQFKILKEAITVFGEGNVSTHVIIGLGETEKEAADAIQTCFDITVLPALFAFTPVRGTAFEKNLPPPLEAYRRVQLARYLMVNGLTRIEQIKFNDKGEIVNFGLPKDKLHSIIEGGEPFQTSGCRDCNRPYYNEKPSGPIYNYPRKLKKSEIEEIKQQFKSF